MDHILKNLTLDFFGNGKHKISPEKFFQIENGILLDVRSKEEAGSLSINMSCHSNIESMNIPINEIPDRIDEISKDRSIAVFCPANVRSATVLTGFASGMVGVSGGSFWVPLMVLACGVPMYTAVGTASTLIASTALMGFTGHAMQGDFNPALAIPLAGITVAGGILGGKLALKTKPIHLKKLFAYTNWLAALFMIVNALYTKGTG